MSRQDRERHDAARTQRNLVAEYFEGFRTSDHGEIENPAFAGSPELDVQRVHEDGPVAITTGEGRGAGVDHGPFRFAFNDLFTFRDGLIARVDSYVVPLP